MERTPKNIDDILRERLYDAAPPPPAFVWDNVERELRGRRKRLFLWLFFTGFAGMGLIGLWLANRTEIGQITENRANDQEILESKTSSNNSTTALTLSMHPENVAAAKPGVNKAILETAPLKTNPTTLKINETAKLPQQSLAVVVSKTSISAQNTLPRQPKETTPATLEAKPQKTFFEGGQVVAGFSFATLPQFPGLAVLKAPHTNTSGATVGKLWPVPLKPLAIKPKAKKPEKNCYDFSKQPSVWIIDAYIGPSLAQRELTARPDDRPYLIKRLNTEQRDFAFNTGVRASLMLKGNFLLRTGVQYDQMTEVFEYIDPDYIKYIVEITNQNGTTTIDTVGVEYGEKYQKTYNRFGMLDIPLIAGVELRKGRSGVNINAGVSVNLLFWKRGAILAPDTGEPAWFTPNTGTLNVFRPYAGLSATASVQWFYHITPRLRVFVEPYFKKIMRPVTLSAYPVEQRYGIGGIRLGLSKILN